jgi:hypothetical protein
VAYDFCANREPWFEAPNQSSSGFEGLFLLNFMAPLKLGNRSPSYSGCAYSVAALAFSISNLSGIVILNLKCMLSILIYCLCMVHERVHEHFDGYTFFELADFNLFLCFASI